MGRLLRNYTNKYIKVLLKCLRHGLAVRCTVYRSYVTGLTPRWNRSHFRGVTRNFKRGGRNFRRPIYRPKSSEDQNKRSSRPQHIFQREGRGGRDPSAPSPWIRTTDQYVSAYVPALDITCRVAGYVPAFGITYRVAADSKSATSLRRLLQSAEISVHFTEVFEMRTGAQ